MPATLTWAAAVTMTAWCGAAFGQTAVFTGTDALSPAHPCSIAIDLSGPGQLSDVVLKGVFVGPIVLHVPREEVPSVMSRSLTLDSKVNFSAAPQSATTDGSVFASATGPSLWLEEGTSTVEHTLIFSSSLEAPRSVTYHADQRYGGGLNWLGLVRMTCQDLQPVR